MLSSSEFRLSKRNRCVRFNSRYIKNVPHIKRDIGGRMRKSDNQKSRCAPMATDAADARFERMKPRLSVPILSVNFSM